jgi:alpha-beta hydrolase superfamily lysophospholipase
MPDLPFAPTLSFLTALSTSPLRPLHLLVRTTEEKFRPAQIHLHRPAVGRAQAAVLAAGAARASDRATILREAGAGRVPTIVLGGLVPDATEQVFLLRRFLLKSGDVYYVNFPRDGFSLALMAAQLQDLATELAEAGQPPVIFAVSFGAGIVLEWLRRLRAEKSGAPALSGVVLVSPVTCAADLIAPGAAKPATLLGRALKPFLDANPASAEAAVDKARAIFLRMFEAGAQNKAALRLLMTEAETERLHRSVMDTIRGVTAPCARQRALALTAMVPPTDYFSPAFLPLSEVPALILFAEKEEAVLDNSAPVRLALERAPRAYFPRAHARIVKARGGDAPVQHASLVFHVFEFLPPLQAFYQHVRRGPLPLAA